MTSVYKAKILKGHERPIKHIKFSSDGKFIFSASADRKVIKWDYKNDNKNFYNHQASVNVVCISNSNKYLFSGDSTGCIYVWDIKTNELLKKISFDALNNIRSFNISSDEKNIIITFAVRSKKGNSFVGIYLTEDIISNSENTQNNSSPDSSISPNIFKEIKCSEPNTKYVKSCFANMNKSILISREDGFLEIYDFNSDKLISSTKFHNDEILDFDVNDEYSIIITSSKDGEMSLINLNTFQLP